MCTPLLKGYRFALFSKNSTHHGLIDLADQYPLNVGASISCPRLISVIAPLTNG